MFGRRFALSAEPHFLSLSSSKKEEKAGERRRFLSISPLSGSLPARSSQGERGKTPQAFCVPNTTGRRPHTAHRNTLRCEMKSGGGPPQSKTLAGCPMTCDRREASWRVRQFAGALGAARGKREATDRESARPALDKPGNQLKPCDALMTGLNHLEGRA